MLKFYKDVMRMFLLVVGHFQLVSYPSIQIIGIRTGSPLPSGWEKLFQLLVYFLVEDYTNYCIHRFLHSKLGYEKIHRVHHKYTAPFGFATPYAPGHMVTFWLWSRLGPLKTRSGDDFPWRC
ncbi:PREDICTED: methylsterol monooxygenase 1-1-like [Prunus mume]|uniref:Methylsterol monooxygenase 1-1-like n=1 Tax=Prunus mume TaxID=102107 RepID=A0ABM0PEY3_PRUMU|nr:PREDICTED: methylsterol monooxygenase 1-1-like [Prunus mume]